MMELHVQVTGLKDLSETLSRALPAQVQRRAVAAALKEAARPMVLAARREYLALGGSGSLGIAMASWRNRRSERSGHFASIEVGPKRSNRRALARYLQFYNNRAVTPRQYQLGIRHGHLVEFGTKTKSPARHILSRVQAGHDQQAVRSFGDILARRIEREAIRQAARQRK